MADETHIPIDPTIAVCRVWADPDRKANTLQMSSGMPQILRLRQKICTSDQ